MRTIPLILVTIACSEGAVPALADPAPRGAPEAAGAQLTVSTLVPGRSATFTVAGIHPQEIVRLALGTGLGNGPCVGAAQALCLDITAPMPLAEIEADNFGVATLIMDLPPTLTIGSTAHIQAVVIRGASGAAWEASNVVSQTVQTASLVVDQMGPGDLTITEVMQNPAAVSDVDGEWFEIRNTSGLDVDLDGLRITDFVNDDVTLVSTLLLDPGEYLVIGRQTDPTLNGGAPVDVAIQMDLGNAFDELHLLANAVTVDAVAWDDGASFPDPNGASMTLPSALDHLDNDAGVLWSPSTCTYGDGDAGTPGTANHDADGAGCPTTIGALRDPTHPAHPLEGTIHTIEGAIVTGVWSDGYTIQDPVAASFGALHVYDPIGSVPSLGDEITVTGTYEEYFGLTELTSPAFVVTDTGRSVAPIDVDACMVGTGGLLAEPLESMRVRITAPMITDANPDAPLDFNEFEVEGCLRIDDLLCPTCWADQPPVGTPFVEIVGPLDYRFSDNKVQPAAPADLVF